jgi:alkylation response protein AidB-like acyl-CoA dehydrogenase
MHPVVDRARAIADEDLFPTALATDAADLLPVANLDLLARAGLYGIGGPEEAGGLGLDLPTTCALVETLASGCLTTTFVWLQHRNPVRAVAATENAELRDAWLSGLCRGERRAGIALAGNRPGPPLLTFERTSEGLVLSGEAPWVSGWGRVDVLLVAARRDDRVVTALVDARASDTLTADPLRLVGVNASGTVTLRFRAHPVSAGRIVREETHAAVLERDAASLRLNGSLALGVAARCGTLVGPGPLDDERDACRAELDAATVETMPAARARASELALRSSAALTVSAGSRSILTDQHAQRLARESLFLLVFGSRPPIREALLSRLV